MADKRPWFKMDAGYLDNPKVEPLVESNPRAVILHLACIAYARRHLTDGVVPMRSALRQAYATQSDVDALCSAGLVEVHPAGADATTGAATVVVHDYLEHQTTATDVETAAERGRSAARARWDAERNAERTADPNAYREEKRREEKSRESREDIRALCDRLADRLQANGSKAVGSGKWEDSARLLLDRDARPLDEALRLIDWCQASDFWKPNVLSMPKFREKYDTLRLQAERDQSQPLTSWARAERNGHQLPVPSEPVHHEGPDAAMARIAREQAEAEAEKARRRSTRLAAEAKGGVR